MKYFTFLLTDYKFKFDKLEFDKQLQNERGNQ